jgi:hypothetical protein
MPKQTKPLSDEIIISALPGTKPFKLCDGGGLFLLVNPAGSRLWRLKYRFQGKEKQLALGYYPETSLDSARLLRNNAKCLLKNGLDPSEERKMEKQSEELESPHVINTSVRISNDGMLEIWKGRVALRLTPDEAYFIKDQLCKLIA